MERKEVISMREATDRFPLQSFLDRGFVSEAADVVVTRSISKEKPPEDCREHKENHYPVSVFEIMSQCQCEEALIIDSNGVIIGVAATGFDADGRGTTASYYSRYRTLDPSENTEGRKVYGASPDKIMEKTSEETDRERVNAAHAILWSWRRGRIDEIFVVPFHQ
jgi:hypothetical protein